MQGHDRAGCPQTKGRSGLLDNARRQGFFADARSHSFFTYHAPMLLWHVQNLGWILGVFVSQYYRKETAVHTWGHEIYGIDSLGSFTTQNISPMYIPNPNARRGVGRRQTLRIRNGMDEYEAGKKKKDTTCVEQMVTLTRSALKCKKIMLVLKLDLLGIPPMDCLRILEFIAFRFRYVWKCI